MNSGLFNEWMITNINPNAASSRSLSRPRILTCAMHFASETSKHAKLNEVEPANYPGEQHSSNTGANQEHHRSLATGVQPLSSP
jgi:hypothetical protein